MSGPKQNFLLYPHLYLEDKEWCRQNPLAAKVAEDLTRRLKELYQPLIDEIARQMEEDKK